jgi:hypothetical protein
MPATDDMQLRLRIENVSTYQTAIDAKAQIHVRLDSVIMGPVDTLVGLLAARRDGYPIVTVTVVEIAPEIDDA